METALLVLVSASTVLLLLIFLSILDQRHDLIALKKYLKEIENYQVGLLKGFDNVWKIAIHVESINDKLIDLTLLEKETLEAAPKESKADSKTVNKAGTIADELLKKRLTSFSLLPKRITDALKRGGVKTLGDLAQLSKKEISEIKGIGFWSIKEIEHFLLVVLEKHFLQEVDLSF